MTFREIACGTGVPCSGSLWDSIGCVCIWPCGGPGGGLFIGKVPLYMCLHEDWAAWLSRGGPVRPEAGHYVRQARRVPQAHLARGGPNRPEARGWGVLSPQHSSGCCVPCMCTSLTRKRTSLGPYRRPMPRVQGGSQGGGRFLMGEVPLCSRSVHLGPEMHVRWS